MTVYVSEQKQGERVWAYEPLVKEIVDRCARRLEVRAPTVRWYFVHGNRQLHESEKARGEYTFVYESRAAAPLGFWTPARPQSIYVYDVAHVGYREELVRTLAHETRHYADSLNPRLFDWERRRWNPWFDREEAACAFAQEMIMAYREQRRRTGVEARERRINAILKGERG